MQMLRPENSLHAARGVTVAAIISMVFACSWTPRRGGERREALRSESRIPS